MQNHWNVKVLIMYLPPHAGMKISDVSVNCYWGVGCGVGATHLICQSLQRICAYFKAFRVFRNSPYQRVVI